MSPSPIDLEPPADQNPAEEQTNNTGQLARDIIEIIVLAAVLFLAVNAISARIRVESISMEPALNRDDFVLVDKISYRLGSPGRGDIIVFNYPIDPDQKYVKRIIGLPGEQVKIANGRVQIDGQMLSEPYIRAAPIYEGSWVVPEDSYFVLGDNRNRSNDSHNWGMLPEENVIGRGLLIYWPPNHIEFLIGGNTGD